jgi:hypothetical protein
VKPKVGDLIIITNTIPNWDWLPFREGDLGLVVYAEDHDFSFRMYEVHFFRTGEVETLPEYFMMVLESK